MPSLLEVRDLQTFFFTPEGVVKAVNGASFDVQEGETLGLIGESGCGKSVTALSILRLIPDPPGRIVGGQIIFQDQDLLTLPEHRMRRIRGAQVSMIFQEPMTSLNPILSIERQLTEALEVHLHMSRGEARREALRRLEQVGIPDPERRIRQFPHQFSGGMRQRVMIAMALSCDPRLIIADEPTTALDVTIQAQILELMKDLTSQHGVSLIIITHNLGVVARYADRVNIMYAGKIIEQGSALDIYRTPSHPYTLGLLRSVPRLDLPRKETLDPIEGQPPDLINMPPGCSFRERCRYALDRCAQEEPALLGVSDGHSSACFVAEALASGVMEKTE